MKRKTFEEYWFGYNPKYQSRLPFAEGIALEAFHINDEYIDHLEKRIKELERQNALYKKCVDYYANGYTSWEGDKIVPQDVGWVEDEYSNYRMGGQTARETQRMIDEVSRNY